MKIYRRLLAYAKPYSRYILPFFVFTLIAVFFSIFQFALIIPLLNFLFNSVSPEEAQKYAQAPSFSFSGSYAGSIIGSQKPFRAEPGIRM